MHIYIYTYIYIYIYIKLSVQNNQSRNQHQLTGNFSCKKEDLRVGFDNYKYSISSKIM